jgi:hypothetical protein
MTSETMLARPVQDKNRSLAIGAIFVLLAVMSGSVAFIPHVAFVVLSAIYLGAFLAYLGLRPDTMRVSLFEVIVPYGALSFLNFCVGTMYLVIAPDALDYPALAPFLLPALALATLGFLCFLAGYGTVFRTTAPSPLGRFVPTSMAVYLVPAVLGALGMCVAQAQAAGMLSTGRISSALSIIQQFSSFFWFGWFLTWYMTWAKQLSGRRKLVLLTVLSLLACAVLFFTLGSKSMAFTLLGMPAMAFYEVRRKLPLKSVLVVALIFVFLVFPFYNTFRNVNRELDTSRRVDKTLEMTRGWSSDRYLDASVFAFLKRLAIGTSVAAVISDTGRWVDYKYGETLFLTPIGVLVPRFIWPDKPNISIGREFGATFRLVNVADFETYVAPSMVGELYWNFAVPGVIVGMFVLGTAYRWYFQRYGAGEGFDPIRKSIYASLLIGALLFEGNVAIVVGGVVKALALLVVFLALGRRLGWIEEMAPSSPSPEAAST